MTTLLSQQLSNSFKQYVDSFQLFFFFFFHDFTFLEKVKSGSICFDNLHYKHRLYIL